MVHRIRSKFETVLKHCGVRLARRCMPRLSPIADAQLSMIYPVHKVDDKTATPAHDELMKLVLECAGAAMTIDLQDVSARIKHGPRWPDIWPGEHYKLLAALIDRLQPNSVVEVGTFLGLSALCMKKYLPRNAKLVTFDIIPWPSFGDTCLTQADFNDGRLDQALGDLADPTFFEHHRDTLAQADLIFLDGPKNQNFERAFLARLSTVRFNKPALLVIDDIRLWNMLDIWNELDLPKLDATSLGHFSGTGLVRLGPV